MGLTLQLGEFIADSHLSGFTDQVRNLSKLGFIDSIATTIAGSSDESVQIARKLYEPLPVGLAAILFTTEKSTADHAAFLNGIAGHALDFDDVALRGHPSVVLVSAILPLAQELGSSGIEMMDAYIAGYETWAELVFREDDMHHMKGWHPTGVFGAIGAAAACSSLRKLDQLSCAHAIGIAASMGSGLMSNFGSMTKPLHVGRSAQAGVQAAKLAGLGFTASIDTLEHPQGFLAALSPSGKVNLQRPIQGRSQNLYIQQFGLNIKKYPTCYYTHRAIDALLDLIQAQTIALEQIDTIEVIISKEHDIVLRNHDPKTALEAKFSIEFAMACALVDSCVGLAQLTDESVLRPTIQGLMKKVRIRHSREYDPQAIGWAIHDQVVLHMLDGQAITSKEISYPQGHEKYPLMLHLIEQKFMDCLAAGNYRANAHQLFQNLCSLEVISARDLLN